ncbi:GNAT family N-acetyltransferase [Salmonella enterica subsp. enterica serovar Braenderup]|nr:GNAT family N-acetyltransferase [Salmonella enterica subsp. enterica serovar Braenderup]
MRVFIILKPDSKYGKRYGADVLRLHNHLFAEEKVRISQLTGRDTFNPIERLEEIWPQDYLCACAVDDNGTLLGFMTFSLGSCAKDNFVYIGNYYVLEEARSQGVGRALMDKVRDYGKSKGCGWMSLDVLDNNIKAISVYEKMGFRTECREMIKEI